MHRVWKVAVGVALAAVTGGYAMAQDIVMTVGERSFSVISGAMSVSPT